jgi:uncharacterized protein (DUF488 family)
VRVWTIGHGTRRADELVSMLHEAGVHTLVDIRRYPSSRRNPQFNRSSIEAALRNAGLSYRHAVELGGRRSGEPGEERFRCVRVAGFRSYVARMTAVAWQEALAEALAEPAPCFMCAETPWQKCHRRFVAELLWARGHEVVHLGPGRAEPHRPLEESEARDGRLYLCGQLVG